MADFFEQLTTHRQLCFVHIPKTAGSSLVDSLRKAIPDSCYYFYTREKKATFDGYRSGGLSSVRPLIISGHYSYGEMRQIAPENAAYLSITRDPVDRMLSYYRFSRRRTNVNKVSTAARRLDLHGFLEFLLDDSPRIMRNQQCRFLADDLKCRNRLDIRFEHIERSLQNPSYLVAPIEHCDGVFSRAAAALGAEIREFRRQKVSADRGRDELTDECIELIREHNGEDLLLHQRSSALFEENHG